MVVVYNEKGDEFRVPHQIDVKDWLSNGYFLEKPETKKTNKKSLVEQYNEDKNIVDTLNLKDLKKLCKDLDIEFTEEAEIREHLKAIEPKKEEISE